MPIFKYHDGKKYFAQYAMDGKLTGVGGRPTSKNFVVDVPVGVLNFDFRYS